MGQRRQIAGARILITGASQGIGRALAVEAARQGARVLAAARHEEYLRELAEQVRAAGGTLEYVVADVTQPADRQAMAAAAERRFGGLDVLVNNAGIGATGQFSDVEIDILRKIFEVNVFGAIETTRVCLPLLKRGTKPAILNISSIAGRCGIPGRGAYSASKFAVQGFSEALRAELSKDGIDVIVVNPGLTQTNFSQNMLVQKGRVKLDHLRGMTAEEVARAALKALARGKNEITLTFKGWLLVWFARFLPKVVEFFTKKKIREVFADDIAQRQAAAKSPPVGDLVHHS